MTSPVQNHDYIDEAVYLPSEGHVFYAPVGTEPPSLDDVAQWVDSSRQGRIKADGGAEWKPIGYTSIEDLPVLGADSDGGDPLGVWENPQFRTTPITTTDTVSVQPVQWSEIPLTHRFGAGAKLDPATGRVTIPATYQSVEVALMVIIVDGDRPLIVHYYRGASAPDGDLEADREKFLALPVKYTVLNVSGKAGKGNVIAGHLRTAAAGSGTSSSSGSRES